MLEKSYLHQNGTEFNFLFIRITTRNFIPPRGARGEKRHHWNFMQSPVYTSVVDYPPASQLLFSNCTWTSKLLEILWQVYNTLAGVTPLQWPNLGNSMGRKWGSQSF